MQKQITVLKKVKKLLAKDANADKAEIVAMVRGVYEVVQNTHIKYELPYVNSDKHHFESLIDWAKSYKSKALATLEDLICEITSNSIEASMVTTDKLINSKFFTVDASKLINQWYTLSKGQFQYQEITV